jgi:hypothetical protein
MGRRGSAGVRQRSLDLVLVVPRQPLRGFFPHLLLVIEFGLAFMIKFLINLLFKFGIELGIKLGIKSIPTIIPLAVYKYLSI